MSFWSKSTGEQANENVEKEVEIGGGGELIPDNSTVLAFIKEAKWASNKDGARYINLQWTVEQPESLAGRVTFQKLWVADPDPNAKDANKKRDKALSTLATIDANAGGKLAANGGEPTDDQLALALNTKQMIITVKTWDMVGSDGAKLEGNWVAHVAPKGSKELKVGETKAAPAGGDVDGDEIPF